MRVRTCLAIGGMAPGLPVVGIEDALDAAASAGFRCLDLHVSAIEAYLADYPPAVLGALLAARRAHVGVVSGLTLPPLARVESRILADAQLLELCTHLDALGGGTIALQRAPGDDALPGSSAQETVRVLRSLAELVAPFDVQLALEIDAGGDAQDVVAALERGGEIVARTRRAGVGLTLDLRGSLPASAADAVLTARHVAPLRLVRLGALPTGEDAQGEARGAALRELCAKLAGAGFRGPYSVDPAPAAQTLSAGARAAFETSQALIDPPAAEKR
jgi:sugar phosphate isomerase/epimerase